MKNIQPKVSIITPSYNQGQFIAYTIESVLNQTYPNIEYIVVDGGSTDDTMQVVERYADRIDLVIHEKDKGQSDAINKGFKAATGELVGWINSDDVLHEDCVERIVELYIKNPSGSIYYGSSLTILDKNNVESGVIKVDIPGKDHLVSRNYDVIQPGSFYSLDLVKKVGYLNESIHFSMDLDLWLRLLDKAPIYNFSEKPIACIRKWENTKTSTGNKLFFQDIVKTLKKHGANSFNMTLLKLRFYLFKEFIKHSFRMQNA